MDPISQGALGAIAAHVALGKRLPRSAWLIGCAAGLAPDLDIFINPASDPLGGLLWHRHFTHGVGFIPVGAAICALPFWWWHARRRTRAAAVPALAPEHAAPRPRLSTNLAVYLAAVIGFATHAPLDAATSYGTALWWPFTDRRVAWDCLPIIDPIYTGLLVLGLIAALLLRRNWIATVALALSFAYAGLGIVQRERVHAVQQSLAAARGHTIEHGRAMPAPLSLLLWNSIYISKGELHADAVRMPWPLLGAPTVAPGASTPRVTVQSLSSQRPLSDVERRTIERWDEFADGFVAIDPRDPAVLGDMRYLLRPDRLEALWGLRLGAPGAGEAPRRVQFGRTGGDANGSSAVQWAWSGIMGTNFDFQPVSTLLAAPAP